MIIKTLLVAICVFALLMAGCASSTDGGATASTRTPTQEASDESDSAALTQKNGSGPQLTDLVKVSFETMPPRGIEHGTLIRLVVRNTRTDAYLSFSATSHEFIVYDESGEEVWGRPLGGGGNPTIAPGESSTFQIVWQHMTNECDVHPLYSPCYGELVPAGSYFVKGSFRASLTQVLKDGKTESLIEDGLMAVEPHEFLVNEDGTTDAADPTPSPTQVMPERHPVADLSYGLLAPEPVQPGEYADLILVAGNDLDHDLQVTFQQPIYDFIVTDMNGREVWRRGNGQEILSSPTVLDLEPRERHQFKVTWSLKDNDGNPVPEGVYIVEVLLRIAPSGEWISKGKHFLFVGVRPPVSEFVDIRLEAPPMLGPGESATLKLYLKNKSVAPLSLWYGSDVVDFVVTDENGNEVWSRIRGVIALYLRGLTLQPGELKRFTAEWNQLDYEEFPVVSGIYSVQGIFKASLTDDPNTERIETQTLGILVSSGVPADAYPGPTPEGPPDEERYEGLQGTCTGEVVKKSPLGGFSAYAKTCLYGPKTAEAGDTVDFKIMIRNYSQRQPVSFYINPNNPVRVAVLNDKGEEIWASQTWGDAPFKVEQITLQPNQIMEFNMSWDLTCNLPKEGNTCPDGIAPPGDYEFRGTLQYHSSQPPPFGLSQVGEGRLSLQIVE